MNATKRPASELTPEQEALLNPFSYVCSMLSIERARERGEPPKTWLAHDTKERVALFRAVIARYRVHESVVFTVTVESVGRLVMANQRATFEAWVKAETMLWQRGVTVAEYAA